MTQRPGGRSGGFLRLGAMLLISAALAACSVAPVQLIPATTPVTTNTAYTVLGPAEGSSCRYTFFVPPLAVGSGSLQAAFEDALKSNGADALLHATIDYYFSFYLLGSSSCTRIHGTGIKILNK